jgi:hypothetical protein
MGMVVSAAVTGIPIIESLETPYVVGKSGSRNNQKPNPKAGPKQTGKGSSAVQIAKDGPPVGKGPAKKEASGSAKAKPATGKGPAEKTAKKGAAPPPPSASKAKPVTAKGKKK